MNNNSNNKDDLRNKQPIIYNFFENVLKNNKLSHAYLFLGEKTDSKLIMVQEIMKYYYPNDINYINNLNHPNLIYIKSDSNTIKKEQILNLKDEFSMKSQIEGKRFFIIDEIEKLNLQSNNSLLKFIEEPPLDTHGFLFTDDRNNVIPTILSRCQVLNFQIEEKKSNNLKLNELLKYLQYTKDEVKEIENDFDKVYDIFVLIITHYKKINKDFIDKYYNEMNNISNNKNLIILLVKLLQIYYLDVLKYQEESLNIVFKSLEENIKKTNNDNSNILNFLNYLNDLEKYLNNNVNINLILTIM